jgi:putative phage-type endonuclease
MLISELPELENVLDDIVPQNDAYYNEEEAIEIYDTCIHLMEEYIDLHPSIISEPDFHDIFYEDVEEIIKSHFEDDLCFAEEELDSIIENAFDDFFEDYMPPRSFEDTFIITEPNHEYIDKQIAYLKSKPQPIQRTKEWYEFRQNLITASNAYKAFENQSSKNQLIYEKCQPLTQNINVTKLDENGDIISQHVEDQNLVKMVNINTTLHWGQKYEPLSVMLYEYNYNTHIDDFGCIKHDKYSFLGASPDGINVDKNSSRYGRMLEIKNIVNREIDGIPKKEYWIQMQLQMEVCNLNECDFLETQFVEYDSYSDYINDGETSNATSNGKMKGLIMYFHEKEGKPHYEYRPLSISSEEESEKWEQEIMDKHQNMTWIRNYYWKLEQYSCVLVLRNNIWFQKNIHELEELWEIVLKERETGYEHRAPNKRIKKDNEQTPSFKGLLINIVKKPSTTEKIELDLV